MSDTQSNDKEIPKSMCEKSFRVPACGDFLRALSVS